MAMQVSSHREPQRCRTTHPNAMRPTHACANEHPAAHSDDWMLRFGLNLLPFDYLKGDQNSAGATSESLLKVVAGTFGIVSTENVPKLLLSMSAPPEL